MSTQSVTEFTILNGRVTVTRAANDTRNDVNVTIVANGRRNEVNFYRMLYASVLRCTLIMNLTNKMIFVAASEA